MGANRRRHAVGTHIRKPIAGLRSATGSHTRRRGCLSTARKKFPGTVQNAPFPRVVLMPPQISARHSPTTKPPTTPMKYALLAHQPLEAFNRPTAELVAAGRAYGEALHAAGVLVGGVGLAAPQNTTTVSV